jgi:hypothetical protein
VKLIRRIHLFLGCFFTPLLLLYLLSGFYFVLKPARQKDDGEAQTFLQKIWWVHTAQEYPRTTAPLDIEAENQPRTLTDWEPDTRAFKILIYIMVIGAVATMALGIVLAIRSTKDKRPVYLSLAMGVLLPIVILWFSQKQVTRPNPFHPDTPLDLPVPGIPGGEGGTNSMLPPGGIGGGIGGSIAPPEKEGD